MPDKPDKPLPAKPRQEKNAEGREQLAHDVQRLSRLLEQQLSDLDTTKRYEEILKEFTDFTAHLEPVSQRTLTPWKSLNELRASRRSDEFVNEIAKLKSEINQKTHDLLEQKLSVQEKEERFQELQRDFQRLTEKQNLSHLLTRVGKPAQDKLLGSPQFRALFEQESPHASYVLSIDIRRSTELMLKAREPRLYAEFITILARKLRDVILQNYGVFDKFTGDGVLAFFPSFYTGEDAGYYVLKAAHDCHAIFSEHYRKHKHCFTSVLKDIGLGIGVDYGEVQIVQIGGDFTVVGTPVVYACRMGGADARQTYINQPAFEKLFATYSAVCDFEECEIAIKHEGNTLAYSVELNGKEFEPKLPEWTKEEVSNNSQSTRTTSAKTN